MAADGYNPMRWRCDERGCYNVKHRPKIEVFAGDLPGKIAFGDVDAVVEVGGRFLFLEFKSGGPRDIPYGQRLLFERLTELSDRITVVVACADAETMETRALCIVHRGKFSPWELTNLDALRGRIRAWAARAASLSPYASRRTA